MWKIIFKTITSQLAQIQDESAQKVFEYIDLDRGQIRISSFPQKILPVALVSFLNVPFEDANDESQEGELTFAVDTYFHGFGESFEGASHQDDTLKHLDLLDKVYAQLQFMSVPEHSITPFTRSAVQVIAINRPKTFGYRTTFKGQVAQRLPINGNLRSLQEGDIQNLTIEN